VADTEVNRLHFTDEARIWAQEFCRKFVIHEGHQLVPDQMGLMIGWFANAIETGKIIEFTRFRERVELLEKEIELWKLRSVNPNPAVDQNQIRLELGRF
jgi:hypothetical protein